MADSRRKGSRISEINRNLILRKKLQAGHPEPSSRIDDPSCFFTVLLNGWKKFATLLPNNWLAETPQAAYAEEVWRTVGGKGADFWNQH
ncbi:hypothetical protein [Peribacillus frigoritolerans]|uniref:Uncharacterized protein n=1 Tax=Peribacillus castrilensis TaxID=2897690 RepID=A0AAW9NHK0_9BACI|nr:hypothetical protein [Peribacillus castrilensis]